MYFLLFFYRFFSILTFFYPPRCVSCCLSDSCEFFYITHTYLKLTQRTLAYRIYIPLHRRF